METTSQFTGLGWLLDDWNCSWNYKPFQYQSFEWKNKMAHFAIWLLDKKHSKMWMIGFQVFRYSGSIYKGFSMIFKFNLHPVFPSKKDRFSTGFKNCGTNFWVLSKRFKNSIVKILNLYIMLSCTHL